WTGRAAQAHPQGEITMKRLLLGVALLAGCATTVDQAQVETKSRLGTGPTQEEISKAGLQTDNVLTYGLTYDHHRYSPPEQINKANVKGWGPVWNLALQRYVADQAQRIIYDGVMF